MNFVTVFRLIAILLGAASLTILAWKGLGFRFDPFFVTLLTAIEEDYEALFGLITPLVKLMLAQLRAWFDLDLHLYPHWKHAFVLLWFVFGAWARALGSMQLYYVIWGGLCAFVGALLAGTQPLSAHGFVDGPMLVFLVFWFVDAIRRATFEREKGSWWIAAFGHELTQSFYAFTLVAVLTLLIAGTTVVIAYSTNPGVITMVIIIAACAVGFSMLGLAAAFGPGEGPWWRKWLAAPSTRAGLDMLSVLGIAATVVALNQLMTA